MGALGVVVLSGSDRCELGDFTQRGRRIREDTGPGHAALIPPETLCVDLKLDRGGQTGWKSDRMKEGCGAEHSREEPEEMKPEGSGGRRFCREDLMMALPLH